MLGAQVGTIPPPVSPWWGRVRMAGGVQRHRPLHPVNLLFTPVERRTMAPRRQNILAREHRREQFTHAHRQGDTVSAEACRQLELEPGSLATA